MLSTVKAYARKLFIKSWSINWVRYINKVVIHISCENLLSIPYFKNSSWRIYVNYPPDQLTAKSSFRFLNYVHTNSLKLTYLLIFSKVILQFNISFYICCICKPFKIKFLLKFFETLFQINKQLNNRFFLAN